MKLISKFIKGINCFLLCFIDILSQCAWVIPLEDKKGITIINAFQKILDECMNWIEFYNRSMKSFLQNNNMEMYSIHNKGRSVVAKSFIGTFINI